METRTNYTLVGLFVLLLGSGLIVTALWLSVGFGNKVYTTYAVYMNEPVAGLSTQASVQFNGVNVGYVSQISLNHNDPQQVKLLLQIEKGTPITTSTTATLKSRGITGITYIGLSASSRFAKPLKTQPGEHYPVIPSRPSLLVQIDAAVRDVSENFRKVTDSINLILNKDNGLALKNSLHNIEEVTYVLAKHSKALNDTIKNSDILFRNAAKASDSFPKAMQNINASLASIKRMSQKLSQASVLVAETMRSSKNTIKSIAQQAVPPTVNLLDKLDNVANTVEDLARELKNNPSMIIRGRSGKKLGPGEK